MNWFSDRKKLTTEYEKWLAQEPELKDCAFNVISFLENKGLLKNLSDESRKHGHWKLLDECTNEGVYCSVCSKKVYKTDYANQKIKSKYCPNCGSIMDEELEGL